MPTGSAMQETVQKVLTPGKDCTYNVYMTTKPVIVSDEEALDEFETFDTERIRSNRLRSGMLLVDVDLGTPVYMLDHRCGDGQWLVHDLEAGGFKTLGLGPLVPVAVR